MQRAAGEVGADVLRAAREAAADADHQRDAPRVGAQHPVALRRAEAVVARVAGQALVERRGGDEPEAVRGGVEVVVDHAGAERVLAGALHAARELGAEVGEQLGLADRDRELPARTDQLGVRDRADVVEVERVLALGAPSAPTAASQSPARGSPSARAGERQLRAAELEVVAPRGLGVERVRERGGDVAHVAGLRGAVDLRGGGELGARPVGLGRGVELRGEREGGRHAAGEVGRDRLAGRVGAEDGAVAQVAVAARPSGRRPSAAAATRRGRR